MKQTEFDEIVDSCERELHDAGNTLSHGLLHAIFELIKKALDKGRTKRRAKRFPGSADPPKKDPK